MARYLFKQLSEDEFELFESGFSLMRFRRSRFRDDFEKFALNNHRSSNWIGSILTLFLRQFPYVPSRAFTERHLDPYRLEDKYISHLLSRGFRVYKSLDVSDAIIVGFLRGRGFIVLCPENDHHYSLVAGAEICLN